MSGSSWWIMKIHRDESSPCFPACQTASFYSSNGHLTGILSPDAEEAVFRLPPPFFCLQYSHEESLWPTDLPPDLLHGFRHAAMPAAKVRRFFITVFDYNRFSFTGKRSHKTESQKHPVLSVHTIRNHFLFLPNLITCFQIQQRCSLPHCHEQNSL